MRPHWQISKDQQQALHQNLAYVADTLDRAEPAKIASDEVLADRLRICSRREGPKEKEDRGAL